MLADGLMAPLAVLMLKPVAGVTEYVPAKPAGESTALVSPACVVHNGAGYDRVTAVVATKEMLTEEGFPFPQGFTGVTRMIPLVAVDEKVMDKLGDVVLAVNVAPVPE